MRFARWSWLLPLLLASCGSKSDLVIGILFGDAAGGSGATNGGATAEPTAGTTAVSGVGGSDATGGTIGAAGVDSGAAGLAGAPAENCVAGDEPPADSLVHRYSFDGSGMVATDTSGTADGQVVGGTLDGSGALTMNTEYITKDYMPGDPRSYVDLPNGIVSTLPDLTVVAWLTWSGEAAYARVFDFGIGDNGEGLNNNGVNYIAVMPKTGFDNQRKPGLGAEMKVPGMPTVTLASTEDMKNRPAQVSFVFKSGVSAALYLDGNLVAIQPTAIALQNIDDRNNWIGMSEYFTNPPYIGTFEEFRIYNAALDSCQLHTLLVRGPQTP